MVENLPPQSEPASLHGRLRRARRRQIGALAGTAFFAWAAGALVLLWAATWGMAAGAGTWPRGAALVGIGLGAAAALAWFLARARHLDARGFARRAEEVLPEARGLVSALELEVALEDPDFPHSVALARAHVQDVSLRLTAPALERLVDRRAFVLSARTALGTAALTLLGMAIWPQDFGRLMGVAVPEPQVERRADPITGDVTVTYHYPAYTGLPPRRVEGTAGELSALRGTEARIETRADRPVARAFVEIGEASLPLEVEGDRLLRGTIRLQTTGSYAFRFEDARGRVLARGPSIPIQVIEDQAPTVQIGAPIPELVVTERDVVEIQFEATDDYGLSQFELVYKLGPTEEQVIPLGSPGDGPRRASRTYTWQLATLDLRPGETVTYYVRARDNDTVSGPKWGQSRTQVLQVFSEAEHRRELLALAEAAWEQMLVALGDRIEPREGPLRVEGVARIEAGRRADGEVEKAVSLLQEATGRFAKDELAPAELFAALQNVTTQLSRKAQHTRATRERTAKAPTAAFLRLLDEAEGDEQEELERGVLYLESLLDRQRILEIEALSRELSESRAELTRLLESYQDAPTDEARQAVLRELARLRKRIEEMMQRMAELSRGIQDEHLNLEAQRSLAKERDLLGQLDEVEKKVEEGDIEGALAEMQKLAMQMDALTESFGAAADQQVENDPALQQLAEALSAFEEELAALESEQKELTEQTQALRQEQIREMQQRLAQGDRDPVEEMLQKVETAKRHFAALPEHDLPRLSSDEYRGAVERTEGLEHALRARDFDAALESSAAAVGYSMALVEGLERERGYAQRFGIGSAEDLQRWLGEASLALPKLQEVKSMLERMFSDRSRLTPRQRQALERLAENQRKLGERMEALRQQAQSIGEQAPIFDDGAMQTMEQAQQSMQQASDDLRDRRIGEALSAERRAEEQLGALRQALEQAQQQARSSGGRG
ncbi:MAG TPA: DUF4175 family protein, partial [Fredinandcohnia sp.]|nr:DUF4175 family protein [Fredinandcohnia sp.]